MAAYRVPEHIWRTNDGRLVLTGDPAAAILAYPTGEEMSDDEAVRLGIVAAVAGKPVREVKDKAPASKVSGVTINRANKETNHG
jgi:hypothetical protein